MWIIFFFKRFSGLHLTKKNGVKWTKVIFEYKSNVNPQNINEVMKILHKIGQIRNINTNRKYEYQLSKCDSKS